MANIKKVGNVTVNDGHGLMDNEGLIDSLIIDCNNAVKEITNGQYIAFCDQMVQMVRKLANLKKGIINDLHNRDEMIEKLKKHIRELGEEVEDVTPNEFVEKYSKKDGDNNGEG